MTQVVFSILIGRKKSTTNQNAYKQTIYAGNFFLDCIPLSL